MAVKELAERKVQYDQVHSNFDFDIAIKLIKNCAKFNVEMSEIKIASWGRGGDTLSFRISGRLSDVKMLNKFVNESN